MRTGGVGWLPALGIAARRGFARVTPEPFAVAVLLTVVVLIASAVQLGGTPAALAETLTLWQRPGGLWSLLAFGMQMSLMLVLGSALAEAPPIHRGLLRLARASGGPRRLVGLTAWLSCTLALGRPTTAPEKLPSRPEHHRVHSCRPGRDDRVTSARPGARRAPVGHPGTCTCTGKGACARAWVIGGYVGGRAIGYG